MSGAVFLKPSVKDDIGLKRVSKTTAFGTAGSLVAAAAQGRVYKVTVTNKSATRYVIQIHDKATVPVATNVPIWEDTLPPNESRTINFELAGLYFANGLGLAISSTVGVLTLAVADDATAHVLYASSV